MPIDVQNYLHQAMAISSDQEKVHVNANDELTTGTGLQGLKKLSIAARKAENIATTQAFLDALANDPRYAARLQEVRAPLDLLINTSKPLTSRHIINTITSIEIKNAFDIARDLVAQNKLPQGHATSFSQYVVAKELNLNNLDAIKNAIKNYYLDQIIVNKNLDSLSTIPNQGSTERTAVIAKILKNLDGPLTGQNGLYSRILQDKLQDFDNFNFDDITQAFEEYNHGEIEFMHNFSTDLCVSLQNMGNISNIMTTFHEAQETIGFDKLGALRNYIIDTQANLATIEDRAAVIKNFMIEDLATKASVNVMSDKDLPESFASAIGHNPQVVAATKEHLANTIAPNAIPTREEVSAAIAQFASQFTTEHYDQLQEFAHLANNPNIDLNPPLTAETMPRYINTMLAGEAILQPLLGDNGTPIDEKFLQHIAVFSEAMNSATHSVKGEFGADDIAKVLTNSIKIMLTRHEVKPSQYGEIMARVINKFGPLASEIQSLNSQIMRGLGGAHGYEFFSTGMTMYRALEGHARALISLMNHDQLVAFNIKEPEIATADDVQAHKRNGKLLEQFLEENFQKDINVADFSSALARFVSASGLNLQVKFGPDNPNEAQANLEKLNNSIASAVLTTYIPDTGRVIENKTQNFTELFNEIAKEHDLTGINLDKLNISTFLSPVKESLAKIVAEANAQGVEVESKSLHTSLKDALTTELVKIKSLLDAVDNLPHTDIPNQAFNDKGESVFTTLEKNNIKNCLMETAIRDIQAITNIAAEIRTFKNTSYFISSYSPCANGRQLSDAAISLSKLFIQIQNELPAVYEGSHDALNFMLRYGLETNRLSAFDQESLLNNLNSDVAKNVFGAIEWAIALPEVKAGSVKVGATALEVLTQLQNIATTTVKGNAERDSAFYANTTIHHPSEIQGGVDGCMEQVHLLVGNAINNLTAIFNRHNPPFSAKDWNTLESIANSMLQSAPQYRNSKEILYLISSSANDLLKAVEKNKGKPLNGNQLWDIMIGGKRPKGLDGPYFGQVIYETANLRYQRAVKLVNPSKSDSYLSIMFGFGLSIGLSAKKLFELLKPNSSLTLDDIQLSINMSSLRTNTPDTAYGLKIDFPRQDPRSTLSFDDGKGHVFSVHPFPMNNDAENTADHPIYQQIIGFVRNMTNNREVQLRRVLQSFTQASLISAQTLSSAFAGAAYSEHGNFQMKATLQDDGAVLIDIASDQDLPLKFYQQFRVEQDGSHTCTAFSMQRT